MNTNSIEWIAPEHLRVEKTQDWYWAVGIISVSLAIIALVMSNPLFAVLVIIAAVTLSMFASKKPDDIVVRLDPHGVTIGKFHFAHPDIETFWVETHHIVPVLIIKPKKLHAPLQTAHIPELDPAEIRSFLLVHLKEEELYEPMSQKIMEYLGF